MDTVWMVILGLVVLASFVIAYLSAKTWRVFQVVLVVFVFLATLPFLYLSARTLKIHAAWRKEALDQQAEIERLKVDNEELREGATRRDPAALGIRQLKLALHQALRDRGGVWRGVAPGKPDEKGAVEVTVASETHGIAPKMVLFAFDESKVQDGGRYLGEFRVIDAPAGAKTVKMEPNLPLDEAGTAQLAKSQGPWSLYAAMPVDRPEIFAAMTDQERASLLPAESVQEFANKERRPYDYSYAFWRNHRERLLTQAAIGEIKTKVEATEKQLAAAREDVQYREAEKGDLQGDRDKFQYERGIVDNYHKAIAAHYEKVLDARKEAFFANYQHAAQIAAMQLEAARAIEARVAEQAKADAPPAEKP